MSDPTQAHSPTPWLVNRGAFGAFIEDARGEKLIYVFDEDQIFKDLPRVIVAVNAHDALLAACVEALAALDDDSGTCRRLRAAIAAAKGGGQ